MPIYTTRVRVCLVHLSPNACSPMPTICSPSFLLARVVLESATSSSQAWFSPLHACPYDVQAERWLAGPPMGRTASNHKCKFLNNHCNSKHHANEHIPHGRAYANNPSTKASVWLVLAFLALCPEGSESAAVLLPCTMMPLLAKMASVQSLAFFACASVRSQPYTTKGSTCPMSVGTSLPLA